MRLASTNAGEFKNLCVEMQKTPVNRGVLSLLNGSKQVQNGLPVTFPIVTGFISDDLPLIGIQEIAGPPEQSAPTNPGPPMSRRKQLPTTHRLAFGPDFANSSRFHSAPFQRRPVNHSTGPRFHSSPFHRLKSSKTGTPGAVSA